MSHGAEQRVAAGDVTGWVSGHALWLAVVAGLLAMICVAVVLGRRSRLQAAAPSFAGYGGAGLIAGPAGLSFPPATVATQASALEHAAEDAATTRAGLMRMSAQQPTGGPPSFPLDGAEQPVDGQARFGVAGPVSPAGPPTSFAQVGVGQPLLAEASSGLAGGQHPLPRDASTSIAPVKNCPKQHPVPGDASFGAEGTASAGGAPTSFAQIVRPSLPGPYTSPAVGAYPVAAQDLPVGTVYGDNAGPGLPEVVPPAGGGYPVAAPDAPDAPDVPVGAVYGGPLVPGLPEVAPPGGGVYPGASAGVSAGYGDQFGPRGAEAFSAGAGSSSAGARSPRFDGPPAGTHADAGVEANAADRAESPDGRIVRSRPVPTRVAPAVADLPPPPPGYENVPPPLAMPRPRAVQARGAQPARQAWPGTDLGGDSAGRTRPMPNRVAPNVDDLPAPPPGYHNVPPPLAAPVARDESQPRGRFFRGQRRSLNH